MEEDALVKKVAVLLNYLFFESVLRPWQNSSLFAQDQRFVLVRGHNDEISAVRIRLGKKICQQYQEDWS